MADIRIKDLPTTATQTASDDFIALDGTVNGTRKIDASAPSFKTSVTSPSIVAPASTALTLAGGSTGASLVLGQGTTAGNFKAVIPVNNNTPLFSLIGGPGTTNAAATRLSIGGGGFAGFESLAPGISAIQNGALNYSHLAVDIYDGSRTEAARFTTARNLLIGTTTETGLTGAGNLFATGALQTNGGVRSAQGLFAQGTAGNYATGQSLELLVLSGKGVVRGYDRTGASALPIVLNDLGGNVLIGTTTDITGTGGLHVAGTSTASTTTSGALRVGSNVGLSGNAGGASYFGGNLNVATTKLIGADNLNFTTDTTQAYYFGIARGADTTNRFNGLKVYNNANGAVGAPASRLGFYTDKTGVTASTEWMTLNENGNLNIATTTSASSSTVGALTIGNGTAATNVAIGGGNVFLGGTITSSNTAGGQFFSGEGGATTNRFANVSNAGGQIFYGVESSAGGSILTGTTAYGGVFATNNSTALHLGTNGASRVTIGATGIVSVVNSTPSTLTTNGALVVTGGVGVGGALNVGGGIGSYGASTSAGVFAFTSGSMTGTNMYGFTDQTATYTVSSPATEVMGHRVYSTLALGASGTLANWYGFSSTLNSKTGAAVLTNAYAFYANSPTQATNNYAFYSAGTAPSVFGGAATFGGIIKPQQATTAGAPAYVKGAIYFDTTLNKLRVGGATAWETITSV